MNDPCLAQRAAGTPQAYAWDNEQLSSLLDEFSDPSFAGWTDVISTGFASLDADLGGGLHPGTVTVVAGVPGVGTSMFVLGLALNATVRMGLPSLLMAPDANQRDVRLRALSNEAKTPLGHLLAGTLDDDDRRRLEQRAVTLRAAPLIISAGWLAPDRQKLAEVLAEYATSTPLRLCVADQAPDDRASLRALKVAAQRHHVAVVVTVKARRSPDSSGVPRPQLSDLQLADDVADLADVIVALHRDDMYEWQSTRPGEADVEVLKNRFGPTRLLEPIAFQGHYARLVEMVTA